MINNKKLFNGHDLLKLNVQNDVWKLLRKELKSQLNVHATDTAL